MKKAAVTWLILIGLTALYPPVAQNLGGLGTGDWVGYRFAFDLNPLIVVDWGILVFQWLLITGLLWLLAAKTKIFAGKKE